MWCKDYSVYVQKYGYFGGHIYREINEVNKHSDKSKCLFLMWPNFTLRMK